MKKSCTEYSENALSLIYYSYCFKSFNFHPESDNFCAKKQFILIQQWQIWHEIEVIFFINYLDTENVIQKYKKVLDQGFPLRSLKVPRISLGKNPNRLRLLFPEKVYWGKICVIAVKRGFCGAVRRVRARAAEKARICESLE